MSFVVGLSLFISLLFGVGSYFLSRRRQWFAVGVTGASFIFLLVWFLHPACVPLSGDDVAGFDPPIETRADTGMIGQRLFLSRDGAWYQCKVWIARATYF